MPKPNSAPAPHLGYLDGLRGLAAVFVVLHHALFTIWPVLQMPLLDDSIFGWMRYGHWAVDLFIVLSGFCLMLPVVRGDGTLRGGAWRFLKRRARRILPPYYFALALSLVLIQFLIGRHTGTHWDASIPVSRHGLFTHLLLIQNWYGDEFQINHAFWSIAVECQIYLLFPLLIWLWQRLGGLAATALAVLAAYAATGALGAPYVGVTVWFVALFALGAFAAGIAYGEAKRLQRLRGWGGWVWLTLALALTLGGLCWRGGWQWAFQYEIQTDLLVGAVSAALLVALSRVGKNRLRDALSRRPLVALGTFAYSVYLIHAPLLQVIWQYGIHPLHLGPTPSFLLLTVGGLPIILVLSFVFFLACERPFLNTRRRETPAETARDAALSPAP